MCPARVIRRFGRSMSSSVSLRKTLVRQACSALSATTRCSSGSLASCSIERTSSSVMGRRSWSTGWLFKPAVGLAKTRPFFLACRNSRPQRLDQIVAPVSLKRPQRRVDIGPGDLPEMVVGGGPACERHCQLEQSEGDFRRFASAIYQVACAYEAYVVSRTSTRPQVDSAPRLHLSVASPKTPVSPHGKRVRLADLPPHSNFGGEPYIEAAVIRLPSGSYARSTSRLLRPRRPKAPSRQAFHTTQNPAGYPIRAVASLRVRHGQLTRLDSHQLGRSLVGCSSPHSAQASPEGVAGSVLPRRLEDPAPQPDYVLLMKTPVNCVPIERDVLGSVHRDGVQLAPSVHQAIGRTGSPAHVSTLSSPAARAGIRPVPHDDRLVSCA